MKAFLKNYRQSPRKVRLVASLLKGKRVADAFVHLHAMPKRASGPMEELLKSAVANAKQAGLSEADLYVANITVDKGIVMKRSMPRARGSASRINKRTSHIALTLIEKNSDKKVKATKKEKSEKKESVLQPADKKVKKAKAKAKK